MSPDKHVLLSHPSALSVKAASNAPHLQHECPTGLSNHAVHVHMAIVCSICAHLKVQFCFPLPFNTEATPQVWISVVNKAPTVSQSGPGVHMKSVNGSIFPLLYGHNKSLNMQDQKTDSTAASLLLDEWNSTTLFYNVKWYHFWFFSLC